MHPRLLSTHNHVFAKLIAQIINLWANHPEHTIKTIRMDNAAKFSSQTFNDYFLTLGITLEHSVPYVHTQIEMAEYLIKRLKLIQYSYLCLHFSPDLVFFGDNCRSSFYCCCCNVNWPVDVYLTAHLLRMITLTCSRFHQIIKGTFLVRSERTYGLPLTPLAPRTIGSHAYPRDYRRAGLGNSYCNHPWQLESWRCT